MKKIIIIFYDKFTIYLRFNYTCNKTTRVDIFTLFSFMYLLYLFKGFSRTHFLLLVSSFTFRNAVHFIKKKQNKTCIAVITRLTYVAMLSAIDPVVNLALMVFLSNGSNIRHSSVSRCPTSQISPVLCGALEDFNTAVNEHLLAI